MELEIVLRRMNRVAPPLLAAACAAAVAATPAAGQQTTPPDNSSIDQYAPSLPDAAGNKVPSTAGHGAHRVPGALSPGARAAVGRAPDAPLLTGLAESPQLGAPSPEQRPHGRAVRHRSGTGTIRRAVPSVFRERRSSLFGALGRSVGGSGAPLLAVVAGVLAFGLAIVAAR